MALIEGLSGGDAGAEEAEPPEKAARAMATVTFAKTESGFGMRMSKHGVITGYEYKSDESAAATAGLPLGSTVVRVNGVDVSSKKGVKAQLQEAGAREVEFTVILGENTMAEQVDPAPAVASGMTTRVWGHAGLPMSVALQAFL